MADRLAGSAGGGDLDRHIARCQSCGEEWQKAARTWQQLGELPEEEPGPMLRARFYQMLEAYEEGLRAAEAKKPERRAAWWWPRQPAMQFAAAMCLLVIGIFAGTLFPWERRSTQEVAGLRSEVANMRQMVALSLLQQQSANDRLRGVTYSLRAPSSDTEVLSALLRTVNTDESVNVRLSAIDALRQFKDSPVARRGIAQALAKQRSPLVQISLMSLIAELQDAEALPFVEALANDPASDPNARERAQQLAAELRQ